MGKTLASLDINEIQAGRAKQGYTGETECSYSTTNAYYDCSTKFLCQFARFDQQRG